jgi:hypothetical protein
MLRERRKQSPAGENGFLWLSIANLKLRKREPMEIAKDIRDLAFVILFIAMTLAPRIVSAYAAVRKDN